MLDDLRARVAEVLEDCRTLIPTVQADAVMTVVAPELERRDRRIEEYRESRKRWMDAAYSDRRASNAIGEQLNAALAALQAVREAQSLGEALAAVAKHDGLTRDLVAEDPIAQSEQPDRCPRCWCGDCGGRLDEHTETGCGCESCTISPNLACSLRGFLPDAGIGYIAEQLGPLLSVHLGPKQQQRCLAVAHAANHALRDYDQRMENPR